MILFRLFKVKLLIIKIDLIANVRRWEIKKEFRYMNKLLTKGCYNLVLAIVFLSCGLVATPRALGIEQASNVNVVGSWTSDPVLGQLGFIQISYTFNADGSYSNKMNFISFCKGQAQDCEYFWIISEGRYSVKSEALALHPKKLETVILRRGKTNPDIHEKPSNLHVQEFFVELLHGNLVMTNKKNGESVTLKPEE